MKMMPALRVVLGVVLTCQGYKHVFCSSTAATCELRMREKMQRDRARVTAWWAKKKQIAVDNDCFETQVRERVAPPWHTDTVLIHKHAAFTYVYMSGRTVTIGRMTASPANEHQNVVTWVVHKGERAE